MNKTLIIQSLLSLLSDGRNLEEDYKASLDILLSEHEKHQLKEPLSISTLVQHLEGLPQNQKTTLILRSLLLGLRLQSPILLERSKRLAAHFEVAVEKAQRYLETFVSQKLACTPSINEFLHPPKFINHLQELLYPAPIKTISHISPIHYRHPKDVEATTALEKNYPFEALARLLSKEVSEKALNIQNSASAIQVNEKQFPHLHHRFQTIAKRMGIKPIPDLFLSRGPINAYTAGVENTFVVLQEGAISQLSEPELDFIIGHELGHVKFEHVLYQMIARLAVAQGMLLSPNIFLGRIVGMGMDMAIRDWARKAELSCDRAGLLACQNPAAAIKVMLRFAGVPTKELEDFNIEAYLAQYDTFTKESTSGLGRVFKGLGNTHPWIIERIQAMQSWIEEGHYHGLLDDSPLEKEQYSNPIEHAPLLGIIPLPSRWVHALKNGVPPMNWIIGERDSERERLLNCWQQTQKKNITQKDFRDAPSILPGDSVLYSLNASALLSSAERSQIDAIAQIPHIQLALGVWGMDDLNDELLEEDETKELRERLDDFISNRPIKIVSPQKGEPLNWTPQNSTPESEVHKYIFQKIKDAPIDIRERVEEQKKTFKKSALLLQTGVEKLRKSFPSWFEPMSLEERRHEGLKRLYDELQEIYKTAFEHKKPNLNDISLPKRATDISKTLVAAGIGSIGFGALIVPTLPVWVIATGVGIGVASFSAGKWELKNQHQKTMGNHLELLDQWLQKNQKQALNFIKTQEEELDLLVQKVEEGGWENSILEIEKIWEANRHNM